MRTKKVTNYQKEEYRGTIKQIMKVRGLRTISLANYNDWAGKKNDYANGIHSFKIDIQDGYVNAYGFSKTKKGDTPVPRKRSRTQRPTSTRPPTMR